MGTACAIVTSRAHGAGDPVGVARTVRVAQTLAFVLTLGLCLAAAHFAVPLLAALGAPPEVARVGAGYFAFTVLALPLMMNAAITTATFRALGHAPTPMAISIVAVLVNAVLAYVLVTGWGGLFQSLVCWGRQARTSRPRLFGRGCCCGCSTSGPAAFPRPGPSLRLLGVTSRQNCCAWHFPWPLPCFRGVAGLFSTPCCWGVWAPLRWPSVKWFSRSGASSWLPRMGCPPQVQRSLGTLWGPAAPPGPPVGACAPARRRVHGERLWVLFMGSAFFLPHLYPGMGAQTLHIAFWDVVINGAFQVFKARNMILGGGVVPSGGDTRVAVIGDLIGPFAVGLLLAFLLAFPLGLGGLGGSLPAGSRMRWSKPVCSPDALARTDASGPSSRGWARRIVHPRSLERGIPWGCASSSEARSGQII